MAKPIYCPQCGAAIRPEHRFCPGCGSDLSHKGVKLASKPNERKSAPLSPWAIIAVIVGILVLPGILFGGDRGGTGSQPSATRQAASSAVQPQVTKTPRPTATSTPVPISMSRDNPAPAGGAVVGDDGVESRIVSLDRGEAAWKKIVSYNRYNDKPDDGTEYVLLTIQVRYLGGKGETERVSSSYYRIVGESGAIQEEKMWLTLNRKFAPELFKSGQTEGEVVFQVARGEGGLVLIYSGTGTKARYLALE